MKKRLMPSLGVALLCAALLPLSAALAAIQTFKITGDRNLAVVESNTSVENFTGRTAKVTGEIRFDQAAKTGSGLILVDAVSITTGLAPRDGNMRGPDYMNFTRHPQIRFETTSVKHDSGDAYTVTGRLSMSGKTVNLTVPATLRLIQAGSATRELGLDGDVVNLRTRFSVNLSDFGVVLKGRSAAAVSSTPTIQLNVFASNK
jgi:polyisoprenoid-binding protein YceI